MRSDERGKKTIHSGSKFTDFLEDEGIREEAEAIALKRVIAWQLQEAMKAQGKTKQALAREIKTSRSQLDRLLDPENVSVSLVTIAGPRTCWGSGLLCGWRMLRVSVWLVGFGLREFRRDHNVRSSHLDCSDRESHSMRKRRA